MAVSLPIFSQVAINTDGSAPTDPKAMLEVKKNLYSKFKIRSTHFNDTSVLELSNKTSGNIGTDFRITAKREQGLFFTSTSDLPSNTNDSLLTILTNGNVGIGNSNPAERLNVNGILHFRVVAEQVVHRAVEILDGAELEDKLSFITESTTS